MQVWLCLFVCLFYDVQCYNNEDVSMEGRNQKDTGARSGGGRRVDRKEGLVIAM